jgi:hypothetical protein
MPPADVAANLITALGENAALRALLVDVDYEARQFQPHVPETCGLSEGLRKRIDAALAET